MKKVLPYLVLLFLAGEIYQTYSWDSTAAKFMPLKIGNHWTWFRATLQAPGPGYENMKVIGITGILNHTYFVCRYNNFAMNGTLYSSTLHYLRVDSTTGNLYSFDSSSVSDCLNDSLSAQKGDSTMNCSNKWYRCDTGFYSIFSQSVKSKSFGWSNYFEAGDGRTYAMGFGKVFWGRYAPFNNATWNLTGCVVNGVMYGDTNRYLGIVQTGIEIPEKFNLSQNYPNPFNPVTKIKFQIPSVGNGPTVNTVRDRSVMKIYNTLGHEVQILVNQSLQPGTYEVDWDASNYPSGVYFYELTSGDFIQTRKMVLIK